MVALYSLFRKSSNDTCGYNSIGDLLKCLEFSVVCSKKQFDEVVIYVDVLSQDIIKELDIFDRVVLVEQKDMKINWLKHNLWSYAKIHASYCESLLNNSFCHIDNDVFLIDDVSETLLNNDVVFQSDEGVDWDVYNNADLLFDLFNLELPDKFYCAGIISFTKVDIFIEYFDLFLNICKYLDIIKLTHPNHILEQAILSSVVKKHTNPKVLITMEEVMSKNLPIKYVHLWGGSKRDQDKIDRVCIRLEESRLQTK